MWIYRGWRAVKMINNNGIPFTPQELDDRVKSELMKGLPSKIEGAVSHDTLLS